MRLLNKKELLSYHKEKQHNIWGSIINNDFLFDISENEKKEIITMIKEMNKKNSDSSNFFNNLCQMAGENNIWGQEFIFGFIEKDTKLIIRQIDMGVVFNLVGEDIKMFSKKDLDNAFKIMEVVRLGVESIESFSKKMGFDALNEILDDNKIKNSAIKI